MKNSFKNKYLHIVSVALLCVPMFVPMAAQAQLAFLLNSNDDTLSLIDVKTYKEISRTRVGREPHHWAITPDDKSLIIGSVQSNDLTFVDPVTGAFQKRIDKISDPYQIGFSPDKKWLVSASLALDRTDIYNASDYKLVKRIATPRGPSHMAFSADSSIVYITLERSNEVAFIDLATHKVRSVHTV